MTIDTALILALETRLVNAWPAFEIEMADGWLLRFAEGYSKRANSATAMLPGAPLDDALRRHIEGAFAVRGLPVCFRLTGIEDPAADGLLASAGLVDYDTSVGMVADLDVGLGLDLDRDDAVRIAPAPKRDWITAAAASYGGDKSNAEVLGRIVRLIREPAAFATLTLDGEDVAWGLAVAERGYVGLYDIVVAPRLRGLGLGRRLVTSLMAWGREEGASRAYLQMRETNETAAALYDSLGFTTLYRYGHRVPADIPPRTEAPTGAPGAIGA